MLRTFSLPIREITNSSGLPAEMLETRRVEEPKNRLPRTSKILLSWSTEYYQKSVSTKRLRLADRNFIGSQLKLHNMMG